MSTPSFHALLVEPLATRVRAWQAAGKVDEDDLDRMLGAHARAWVDGVCEATAAIPGEDVESLVALVAEQLGGDAALSDLAREIVADWIGRSPFDGLLRAARPLADGPGFVASQAAEWLVDAPDWSYTGGREGFSLRLRGVAAASPALKVFLGAILARLAGEAARSAFDIHVEGVDAAELVVSGVLDARRAADPARATRLHRAALAP